MLNRSNQVSNAMQCRGYGSAERPTVYNAPVPGAYDYTAIFIIALFLLTVIILSDYLLI
jgi:energy-coupling factor transport system permease protein